MSVILHFKDGTTYTNTQAANVVPYPGDNSFIQLVDANTPPIVRVMASVCNLEVAEIDN
jgi:hypothetical protein